MPTAAAGSRLRHPDAGAAKLTAPRAVPQHFIDFTFDAPAGVPHRLWIRGKADGNSWANDSVFVQFSGAVDGAGRPIYAIGTTSATTVTIEDCTSCGLSGWGWQDNGYARARSCHHVRDGRHPANAHPDARGRTVDRSDRPLAGTLPDGFAGALKNDTVIVPQVQ